MSYILLQIGDKPAQRLDLPGRITIFPEFGNRFSDVHVEYGCTHPDTLFHVYMYNYFRYEPRRIFIEKIFLWDQFHVEKNIWTRKINLNLNDLVKLNSIAMYGIYLRFNFNVPKLNKIPNLQVLSTCVIGDTLQKYQDIQRLPLPKLLKTHFETNYLEGSEFQNSLIGWFFCKTEEKKTLFYFGLPGTYKRLDIYEFILDKSICHWERLCSIKPYDEYIIIRITLHDYHVRLHDIDSIMDLMKKKQTFQDSLNRYPYKVFDFQIKAKLIIISDYAPEIFFDSCKEKEWILKNLFVVKKNYCYTSYDKTCLFEK